MPKQVRKKDAESVQEIRVLRKKAEEQLLKLPNVIGSGIGLKSQSGKLTEKIGLTIFVSKKIPPEQLGPGEHIPAKIIVKGRKVHIDVVEIRHLRPQASIFSGALIVKVDERSFGSVSSFCKSPDGFFGLTCAHVITGEARDPATPVLVQMWSNGTERYIQVGKTYCVLHSTGAGTTDNFGFVDASLFTLEHPELVERARKAAVIQAADPELNEIVQGKSANQQTLTGTVSHTEVILWDKLMDVCIDVGEPGVFGGDSGMLWKNKSGQPVAIHAYGYGNLEKPWEPCFSSAGMFAGRAAKLLGFEFLNEP